MQSRMISSMLLQIQSERGFMDIQFIRHIIVIVLISHTMPIRMAVDMMIMVVRDLDMAHHMRPTDLILRIPAVHHSTMDRLMAMIPIQGLLHMGRIILLQSLPTSSSIPSIVLTRLISAIIINRICQCCLISIQIHPSIIIIIIIALPRPIIPLSTIGRPLQLIPIITFILILILAHNPTADCRRRSAPNPATGMKHKGALNLAPLALLRRRRPSLSKAQQAQPGLSALMSRMSRIGTRTITMSMLMIPTIITATLITFIIILITGISNTIVPIVKKTN